MITRERHQQALLQALDHHPVVAILGPRQVGKTTLARQVAVRHVGPVTWYDLEDPDHLARLAEPRLALGPATGLVVLDEIQRRPDLFPLLRVLVDDPDHTARYLILGSASPDLLRQSSESLAGRILYHELTGLRGDEVGADHLTRLWLRGGFPRSFLAPDDETSWSWRRAFVQTFLERDIPQLGSRVPSDTLGRFWRMLAHYHGQVWNGSELARAFGVSHATVRRYLDLLTGTLVIRQLPPWFANVGKRQVRSPKIYLADSGLLHVLLGLRSHDDLLGHPKLGASWEGFLLGEVVTRLGADPEECFFWATHAGAELDLLIVRGNRRVGVEFKHTTAPRRTRSQGSALETLALEHLYVVHAGQETFPLAPRITAVAAGRLWEDLPPLA